MRTGKKVSSLVLLLTVLLPVLLPGTRASWFKGIFSSWSSSADSEGKLRSTTGEGETNLRHPADPPEGGATLGTHNVLQPREGAERSSRAFGHDAPRGDSFPSREIAAFNSGAQDGKKEMKEKESGQEEHKGGQADDFGDGDWVTIDKDSGEKVKREAIKPTRAHHHQQRSLTLKPLSAADSEQDEGRDEEGNVTASDGGTAVIQVGTVPKPPQLNLLIVDDYDESQRGQFHTPSASMGNNDETSAEARHHTTPPPHSASPHGKKDSISTYEHIPTDKPDRRGLLLQETIPPDGTSQASIPYGEEDGAGSGSGSGSESKGDADKAPGSQGLSLSFSNYRNQRSPSISRAYSCPEFKILRTKCGEVPLSHFIAITESWKGPEELLGQGEGDESEDEGEGEDEGSGNDSAWRGAELFTSEQDDDISYEDLVEAMRSLQLPNLLNDDSDETSSSPPTDEDVINYDDSDDNSSSERGDNGSPASQKGFSKSQRLPHGREESIKIVGSSSSSNMEDSSEHSLETTKASKSLVNAAIKSLQHFGRQSTEEKETPSSPTAASTTSTTDEDYAPLIDTLKSIKLHGEQALNPRDQELPSKKAIDTEGSTEESLLSPRTAKRPLSLDPSDELGGEEKDKGKNKPMSVISPLAPRPQREYPPSVLQNLDQADYSTFFGESGDLQKTSAIISGERISSSTPQLQNEGWTHQPWHDELGSNPHNPQPSHTTEEPLTREQPVIISSEFLRILQQQCGDLEPDLMQQCDSHLLVEQDGAPVEEESFLEPNVYGPIRGIQLLPSEEEHSEEETSPSPSEFGDHHDHAREMNTAAPVPVPAPAPSSYIKGEDGLMRNSNGDVVIEIQDDHDGGNLRTTHIDDLPRPSVDDMDSSTTPSNHPTESLTSPPPTVAGSTGGGQTIANPLGWVLKGYGLNHPMQGVQMGRLLYPPWSLNMQLTYCCFYQQLVTRGLVPHADFTTAPSQPANDSDAEASSSSNDSDVRTEEID